MSKRTKYGSGGGAMANETVEKLKDLAERVTRAAAPVEQAAPLRQRTMEVSDGEDGSATINLPAIEQARPQTPECAFKECNRRVTKAGDYCSGHAHMKFAAAAAPAPERTPPQCQHNNLRLIRKSVDGHHLDLYHCNDCQGIVDVERLTEKPWEHDESCRDGNCEHPDRIEEASRSERALLQEMDGVSEWEAVKLLRDYISDARAVAVPEPTAKPQQEGNPLSLSSQKRVAAMSGEKFDYKTARDKLSESSWVLISNGYGHLFDTEEEGHSFARAIFAKGSAYLLRPDARARQAEPAPTPSRPSDAQIEKLVNDCKRLAEDCDISPAFVHTLGNYLKDYKFAAEASTQGTKEAADEQ